MKLTAIILLIVICLIGVGCASETPGSVTGEHLQDDGQRITCKCGTWAGARGQPTACLRLQMQRQHERQLAAQQAQAQQQPPAESTLQH